MVEHMHIEFYDQPPVQDNFSVPQQFFNAQEQKIIDKEINELLKQGVIVTADYEHGQFISPIFLRHKKNGEYRLILNLKKFNEHVPYYHFKMDTFESALNLVSKNMYFCSVDIRHAYYSVPIAEEHQKYLRFRWKDNLFQFTCLPNGLCCGPRKYTKLMKPVYAKLRNDGHICTGFIDDSLLGGNTHEECEQNVQETTALMTTLGFMINVEKSVLIPTHKISYLGNIIDSEKMIVYLPPDKVANIVQETTKLLVKQEASIRQVAKVIGLLVSAFSAVEYGKLFYRYLEMEKSRALKANFGNFDAVMNISSDMKIELAWWKNNVHSQVRHISRSMPDMTIITDSSTKGWGLVYEGKTVNGRWTEREKEKHINVLETLAVWLAIQSLSDKLAGKHIKVLSDSSTAVCYIANMGGVRSRDCNEIARNIWSWCLENNSWISITHIPGKSNVADAPSREFNDRIEWELDDEVFQQLCKIWQTPEVDLFASRLNFKLDNYCSWKPDPSATFVDAFTVNWHDFDSVYIFAPFSLIIRCIQKIQNNQARAIIIVPLWETQMWFSPLMKLLVDVPIILPKTKHLLTLPHTDQVHPLADKLVMIACLVSGVNTETEDFLRKQPQSSWRLGDIQQKRDTRHIYKDGYSTVVKNKLIKFRRL